VFEHREQQAALVGRHQPLRCTQEQRRAQQILEPRDLVTHRGLRDAQLDRGLCKAALTHRDLEHAQGVERQVWAIHGNTSANGRP
jgi:hypothetical protein